MLYKIEFKDLKCMNEHNSENFTDEQRTVIEGSVEGITYRNDNNGYTVLNINDGGCITVAVGYFPSVSRGDSLKLNGRFTNHKTYGEQFSVESFEYLRPGSTTEIYRFLSSGGVKGIGPSTAAKIIEVFGEGTIDALKDPARLSAIRGISRAKAEKICSDFNEKNTERELMIKLTAFNINLNEGVLICKAIGNNCVEAIEDNPFILCEFPVNFGFERCEKIAAMLGIEPLSPKRIKAGLLYVLRHNMRNGHTCLPKEKLCPTAARLLNIPEEETHSPLEALSDEKKVVIKNFGGVDFVYTYEMFATESYVAGRMAFSARNDSLLPFSVDGEIDAIESINGISYETDQRKAINQAFENGVFILTGGPGTGKTTTLRAIITIMEQHKLKYLLAAPTGRAAKRMMELCSREAKTLHRLLEVEWGEYDVPHFQRDEKNPLDADVIIVDELSMVDIKLFEALLKAMRMGCRLILVGDADQLPAVGAGNVLCDLVSSGRIPLVSLKTVFRQAMKSLIITNAHRIIEGKRPKKGSAGDDFFLIDEPSPKETLKLITELYSKRLPDAYGFNRGDIQILCPSRMGDTGTVSINAAVKEIVNPRRAGAHEITLKSGIFRTGDRVMQVKNNYDIPFISSDGSEGMGVFNGDIGTLWSIDPKGGVINVRFDDKTAVYSFEDADDLEPAYAVTVHKSQGSEYDCVIIPLVGVPTRLCYRNLLYTAVTRAKKLLVLIGSERHIMSFINNDRKNLRYSGLKNLLEENMSGHEV